MDNPVKLMAEQSAANETDHSNAHAFTQGVGGAGWLGEDPSARLMTKTNKEYESTKCDFSQRLGEGYWLLELSYISYRS